MRRSLLVAAAVAVAVATTSPGAAQPRAKDCPPPPAAAPGTQARPAAPERIEGEVTRVDRQSNMVTLRLADGSTQQFRAAPETIQTMSVGDRIEAQKRTPDC